MTASRFNATSVKDSTFAEVFRRIGTSPRRNLRWLVRFVKRDAWRMAEPELLQAIQDVTGFASLASDIAPKELAQLTIPAELDRMLATLNFKDGTGFHRSYPDQDDVKQLQLLASTAIDELLTKGETRFPKIAIEMTVYRADVSTRTSASRSGGQFSWFLPRNESYEIMAMFRVRLAQILAAGSNTLARCPMEKRSRGCQGLFLRTKGNQAFCRQACGSAYRMQLKRVEDRQRRQTERRKGKAHGRKRE